MRLFLHLLISLSMKYLLVHLFIDLLLCIYYQEKQFISLDGAFDSLRLNII